MKLNNNLKNFYYTGLYWAIYYGATYIFLRAYALELGASNLFIGLLGAIPYIAIFLSEIPGAKLGNYYDNKKISVICTLLNRLFWILLIMSIFIIPDNPLIAIGVFFFLGEFFNWLRDPPWTSIIAEIVPRKTMGEYFGYRAKAVETAKMVTSLITGILVERVITGIYGFNIIFSIAILFGLISIYYFNKIKTSQKPRHLHYSLKEFFVFRDKNFKRLVIYSAFFSFAFMIASPFFIVYLLKDINLGYDTFSFILAIETIARIISQRHIGRLSDKYGDKAINFFCVMGTALVPLIYIFIDSSTKWLLIPVSIVSGLVWGGYDLTIFNLLLDNTNNKKREIQVAEYQTITAIPMIIAPLIGGLIADKMKIILSGIPLVFFISFVLRAVSGVFIYKIPETRVKSETSLAETFKEIIHIHPFNGHHLSLMKKMRHFK